MMHSQPTASDAGESHPSTRILDALIGGGLLLVIGGVPLLVNFAGEHVFSLHKSTFLIMAASLLAGLWLIRKSIASDSLSSGSSRTGRRVNPLVLAALLFLLPQVIATVFSIAPATSLWGSAHRMMGLITVTAVVVFFLVLRHYLRGDRPVWRLLWTVVASTSLVSFLAVAEWVGLIPNVTMGESMRPGSTLGNPIFLGAHLVMTIPLSLALLSMVRHHHADARERRVMTRVLVFSLVIQVVALVLTASRGPWIGMMAAASVFAALQLIFLGKWRPTVAVVLAGLGGALVIFLATLPSLPLEVRQTLPFIYRPAKIVDLDSGTVRSRILMWQGALELVQERPRIGGDGVSEPFRHLVGYGPETFLFAFQGVSPREFAYVGPANSAADRAHNVFLDVLTATGILGLLGFLCLLGVAYWQGLKGLRRTQDPVRRLLLMAVLAALSGHLVEKLFGVVEVTDLLLFFTLLALIGALSPVRGIRLAWPRLPTSPLFASSSAFRKALASGATVGICALGLWAGGSAMAADVLAGSGSHARQEGGFDESIGAYQKAIRLAPYRAAYHWRLAQAEFSAAHAATSPVQRVQLLHSAIAQVERARHLEPVNHYYIFRQAQMEAFDDLTLAPGGKGEASALYRLASELSPSNVDFLNEWALYEMQRGRVSHGMTLLQRSLDVDPAYEVTHYLIGMAHARQDQEEAAYAALARAREQSPTLSESYAFLAGALYRWGLAREALGPALRYVQTSPEDPSAHQLLEGIYETLEREEDAGPRA